MLATPRQIAGRGSVSAAFLCAGALLAALLVPTDAWAKKPKKSTAAKTHKVAPAAKPAEPRFSDSGPEPALARVFEEIERNDLDQALALTDGLVQRYPTFRLAHLVRGDLLLAKAGPLPAFGAAPGVTIEQLQDLREEAIARLRAYRDKPQQEFLPRYLLQMRTDQKFAVVVDTKRSRLYLYQNENGRPRFVADYYFTQGKLGAGKDKEGDQRTPIGVYHVTSSLPAAKLPDFYGSGAFPINYPNEWDKRNGKTGHGIWLHGTPSNTFSRPPRASDGCVVLANRDLDLLAKNLQIGLTPVIISPGIEWLSLDDWQAERSSLQKTIETWRQDWESKDAEKLLRHYSRRFESGDVKFAEFARQKRAVAAGKTWIKVALNNLSMFRSPGKDEMVVVTFEQEYQSNNLSNLMKKRQYWIREDGQWRIIHESAA